MNKRKDMFDMKKKTYEEMVGLEKAEAWKKKLKEAKKGFVPWNVGIKHTEASKKLMSIKTKEVWQDPNSKYNEKGFKEKLSKSNIGRKPWNKGYGEYCEDEKNNMWKGDKVGYGALHEWVRRRKPKPEFCECCKNKPPYDLANISGEYKRDVKDFDWLCRSCHAIRDWRTRKNEKKES